MDTSTTKFQSDSKSSMKKSCEALYSENRLNSDARSKGNKVTNATKPHKHPISALRVAWA